MNLRAYQQRALDAVLTARRAGHRAVCVVSPTGSGKTVLGSALAQRALAKSRRVLWTAHRTELVDQAAETLRRFGLPVGIVMGQRPTNDYLPIQVASIQTLLARKQRPEADLVIVDEAHHSMAN